MKRIDMVQRKLSELSKERGVTAGELAAALGLSRANVSSDLNQLCKEDRAEKTGSKPVFYRIVSAAVPQNAESLMDSFVHDNRSLFHCVEQAKAAVLYPPHGMHMLLLGETGVGKSMFAELTYRYVHEKGFIGKDVPFIVFNCADYANNPQLLLSQLMGIKKGAYTGADSDRPGLLEKADGGILFLDEVHCMPPEGQEMLFTFIDREVYRRLGETELERRASVLIICATTENPDSTLLKTFVRRIPMIIKIPNLSERSVDERLNLISGFFRNESARLGKPISVSVNAVRSLLSYNCPNNVGQLKNDIQIVCAKAYSDYVSGRKQDISIVSYDLPTVIRDGLYLETAHRKIWDRFVGINSRFCIFDSNTKDPLFRNREDAENIYEIIDNRVQELRECGADDEEISRDIDHEVRYYFEKFENISNRNEDFSSVTNLVGVDIVRTTDYIIEAAEKRLERQFDSNIRYGMSVHIYNSINRVRQGRRIVNPQLNLIRKEHGAEFAAALESLQYISGKFGISMPIDEAGFLAVFFSLDQCPPLVSGGNVQVIVIAHGASTATSMAEAANRLLGMHYAEGIDASLDENPLKVYARLKALLDGFPQRADTLLLVDMGSLTDFSSELEKELGIRVKTIPLVSTLHVIEAVRKASLGYPLDVVYKETMHVNELLNEGKPAGRSKNQLATMFILTACTTGDGSAKLLKEMLDKKLNYYNDLCETVSLSISDTDITSRIFQISRIGKIVCVISALPLKTEEPFFTLYDVLSGKAISQIQQLIDQEVNFCNIGATLSNMLTYVNGKSVFDDIRRSIRLIEGDVGMQLLPDVLIGVFCHIGCMIDRLKGNVPVSRFPGKECFISGHEKRIRIVKKSCTDLEEKCGVVIPDDELCYIASFFIPENCKRQINQVELL